MIDSEEAVLVKIPLTFESEFESSYSVNDLFIGKVSIVGLYKGKIKIEALKNSLDFFQELGSMQNILNSPANDEIQDSQYQTQTNNNNFLFTSSEQSDKEYHYIDLLAIVQNVNFPK
ncbi:hypothetical protein [Flavobacterium sp. LB2P44]|uniref:hypothetical protein n=1 Tax=Flavobacterium sp. LB2P44 TaxID=3401713 RepID=UPI003AAD5D29